MALSAQEQAEMAQLQKEVGHLAQPQAAPAPGKLTPDEQMEMAQLQKEVGHMAPKAERPWYDVEPRTAVQGALNALPMVGMAGGGMLGGAAGLFGGPAAPLSVPLGGAAGAGLGGAAGTALKNLGEKYILGKDKSRAEIYGDPLKAIPESAAAEMGGQVLGAGIKAGVSGAKGLVSELAAKENAPQISEAAKRLGAKATPGMLSGSQTVQDLESSLQQSPTIGGALVRRQTKPVAGAIKNTAEGLVKDQTPLSPFDTGQKVKELLSRDIESKFAEPSRLFDELRQYTKDIASTPKSTKAVTRNMMSIPEISTFEDGAAASAARSVAKVLEKNPSADEIKSLRTMIGKKAKVATDTDASGLWQIYDKLGRLEENTIKRGAISSARTSKEGETIAQGMLGQLKAAKKGYSTQMGSAEEFAQATGLGKVRTPDQLTEKIGSIKSERLQKQLLPLDDVRAGEQLHQYSPETAGLLRQARLRDIAQKSSNADKVLTPGGLLRSTKNLNPEAEQMLFGKNKGQLQDLRQVNSELPDIVGPSGTPKGEEVRQAFNPMTQAAGLGKYAMYRAMGSDTAQAIAAKLLKKPEMALLAEKDPETFKAIVLSFQRPSKSALVEMPAAAENENNKSMTAGN